MVRAYQEPCSGLGQGKHAQKGFLFTKSINKHTFSTRVVKMTEGYCVKCKAKREMVDEQEVTMKNGRKAIKGKCSKCGTGMYKILGT